MYSEEEYAQLKADYLHTWTDEQLQQRKEELLHLQESKKLDDDTLIICNCQYHDIDEEQGTRQYYRDNPMPSREEFIAKHRL